MKNIKYLIVAALCTLFAACETNEFENQWNEPYIPESIYGNNDIEEHNVITIAQLKEKYPNVFGSTDQNALIEEDIQIKGRVTGNDIGGNLYKQFSMQDETGAIIICVNKNGLSGYLPEGQEVLVDLKGLYIGGYRKQPEIGMPYNGNGIGRMAPDIWEQHYKILGTLKDVDPTIIQPVDFDDIKNDMDANCAKLVTLKNVYFQDADGKATFAPKDGSVALTANCANRQLKGMGANIVIRTSTYADFAAMILPTGPCNLTGIAQRYNSTWQILLRKTSDIEVIN